jgi:PAS domain S-box-containing protein
VKLYGLPRDELIKVGPAQMSPPTQPNGQDSTQAAMEKIGEAMQGGMPVFDWMHRNAQGQDIPCEVRLVRMPGEHPRVRASVTDITERKHLSELTAQRARQQEAINFITQKIQSATTIEDAMKVAVRELGHALGNRQTMVALEPPALPGNGNNN